VDRERGKKKEKRKERRETRFLPYELMVKEVQNSIPEFRVDPKSR
jgi:hypothetical protein